MADDAKTEGAEGTESEGGAATKTFTQEQLDAIVQDRLKRERTKFADYDELKDKAGKFDAAETDKLSEIEKERTAREAAETKASEVLSKAQNLLIDAEIVKAATEAGVKNVKLLKAALDRTDVTVGDDGQVTGLSEAVKAALKENPELVGTVESGSADQGARGGSDGQITADQLSKMSPSEVQAALVSGKLKHLL